MKKYDKTSLKLTLYFGGIGMFLIGLLGTGVVTEITTWKDYRINTESLGFVIHMIQTNGWYRAFAIMLVIGAIAYIAGMCIND